MKLHMQLNNGLEVLKKYNIVSWIYRVSGIGGLRGCFLMLLFGIVSVLYFSAKIKQQYLDSPNEYLIVFFVLVFLFSMILLQSLPMIIKFVVGAFLEFILWLLIRIKLEGLMLFVGSILFIVSKYIAFQSSL